MTLDILEDAMSSDGWGHNTHYHDRLLAAVPVPCRRALDVGCGLGAFARRLSAYAGHVDALDRDSAVISRARHLSTDFANIRFIEADFMTWSGDADEYDFISMVATLHHLPFAPAVVKASQLLRPGGVLGVVGLDRSASLVSAAAQALVAWPVSGWYRVRHRAFPFRERRRSFVGVPVVAPTMTLSEMRQEADALIPGAIVRRHVLWRYSLVWMKPS